MNAATWQQRCETAEKQLQEQENELRKMQQKFKDMEEQQPSAVAPRLSMSSSISSDPSTPSPNEMYLELVAKISDYEQEKLSLETLVDELTTKANDSEGKLHESVSQLARATERERQSEQEALGLRDTIAAYKREIELLQRDRDEFRRRHDDLLEDNNVKDLMDEAQMKISTSTTGFASGASSKPMRDEPASSLFFLSAVGGADGDDNIDEERKHFAAAMHKAKEQEEEMEKALTDMKSQMATMKLDAEKRVQEEVERRLKTELSKSQVKRSESHPASRENRDEMTAALRQQVISLVDELKQSQLAQQKSKEAEEAAGQKYDMLKTQTEMEETKTKSQVRGC